MGNTTVCPVWCQIYKNKILCINNSNFWMVRVWAFLFYLLFFSIFSKPTTVTMYYFYNKKKAQCCFKTFANILWYPKTARKLVEMTDVFQEFLCRLVTVNVKLNTRTQKRMDHNGYNNFTVLVTDVKHDIPSRNILGETWTTNSELFTWHIWKEKQWDGEDVGAEAKQTRLES